LVKKGLIRVELKEKITCLNIPMTQLDGNPYPLANNSLLRKNVLLLTSTINKPERSFFHVIAAKA
jgi:hypothetical protein